MKKNKGKGRGEEISTKKEMKTTHKNPESSDGPGESYLPQRIEVMKERENQWPREERMNRRGPEEEKSKTGEQRTKRFKQNEGKHEIIGLNQR